MKGQDLTGQRFGRLRVVEKTNERKRTFVVYRCECDCGNTVYAQSGLLKNGSVKSCGCLKAEFKPSLVGKKFGRLTVLEETSERKKGSKVWRCKCDCGNVNFVKTCDLTSGATASCGCLHKELCQKLDRPIRCESLIGKKFGRLTVTELVKSERNSNWSAWLCKCECGNFVKLETSSLTNGVTKSCGCLKAEVCESPQNGHVDSTVLSIIASKKISKNNTSGARGVYWDSRKQKWYAAIGFQRKTHFLGYYENFQDAVLARKIAEDELYKPMLEKHNWKGNNENADQ